MKYKLFAIGIVMMLVMSGLVVGAGFGGTTTSNGAGSTDECVFLPGNVCMHPGLVDSVMKNGVGVDGVGTFCSDSSSSNPCWYIDPHTKRVMWDEDGPGGGGDGRVATGTDDIMSDTLKKEGDSVVFTPETGFETTGGTHYYPDGIIINSNGEVKQYKTKGDDSTPDSSDDWVPGEVIATIDSGEEVQSVDYIGDMPYIVTGEGDETKHYYVDVDGSDDVTLSQREYDVVGETIQGAGGFSDYSESGGNKIFTFGEIADGRTRTSVSESDGVLSIYHASSEPGKYEFEQTSGSYQFTDGSIINFDEEWEATLESGGSRVKGNLKYDQNLKQYVILNDEEKALAKVSNSDEGTVTEYVNDGKTYKKTIDDGKGNSRTEKYNDGKITSDYGTTSDGYQYETEYEAGSGSTDGIRYVYDEEGSLIGVDYRQSVSEGIGKFDNLNDLQYQVKEGSDGGIKFCLSNCDQEVNWVDQPNCGDLCSEALQSAAEKKQHEEWITGFAETYGQVAGFLMQTNDLSAINSLIFSQIDGYNELVSKIDSWFAGSVLANPEKALTSSICYSLFMDDPQDMASEGIAVLENSYGNNQQIAMINAEVTESDALLCSLEFDEDDEGEYSCPEGLECNEDDGFCYNEEGVKAHGYFYKVTWGMSAPSDETLTPEVKEGNLAVEYNVWLKPSEGDDINFYESGSETECPLKLSNGESDGAVITWWSDKDYTGDDVCILWDEYCETKIYTTGGHGIHTKDGLNLFSGMTILPDICNTIVKAKTGTVQLTNPDGYSLSTKSSNSDNDVDSSDEDIEVNYP